MNEIIFHLIDYTECFNISLGNKNCEIAKFLIILLRFYCKVWSEFENVDWIKDLPWSERDRCSRKAHDALNKFNRNLLLKLEDIIETDLKEIVIFLLNIEKYDRLNREKKVAAKKNKEKEKEKTGNKRKGKIDTSFLEYDLDRYNSKQTDQKRRTVVEGAEKKKGVS